MLEILRAPFQSESGFIGLNNGKQFHTWVQTLPKDLSNEHVNRMNTQVFHRPGKPNI